MSALAMDYAGVRARLGMPVTPRPRVRLDLIGRETRRPAVVAPVLVAPDLPFYAPFNFLGRPSPERIIRLVSLKHGYRYHDILGSGRSKPLTAARREAVRLVKTHCKEMSSVQLGRLFHRDHSSILNLLGRHRGKPAYSRMRLGSEDGETEALIVSPTINSIHRDGNKTGLAQMIPSSVA